MAEHFAEDM